MQEDYDINDLIFWSDFSGEGFDEDELPKPLKFTLDNYYDYGYGGGAECFLGQYKNQYGLIFGNYYSEKNQSDEIGDYDYASNLKKEIITRFNYPVFIKKLDDIHKNDCYMSVFVDTSNITIQEIEELTNYLRNNSYKNWRK